ncbi:MAG: SpoVG family protein [Tepidisphaeraceae bacterium]
MRLSEIKIHLCPADAGRLKAFCSVTVEDALVIRDMKIIGGDGGLFLAMPSRKLNDHCPRCREKNHLRARFCNQCGTRLNENRHQRYRLGPDRLKLHADIAHPINAATRAELERAIFTAYDREVEKSHEPGYVPTPIDTDVPDLVFGVKSGAA